MVKYHTSFPVSNFGSLITSYLGPLQTAVVQQVYTCSACSARQRVWMLNLPGPFRWSVFKVPRRQQGGQFVLADKHTRLSGNKPCPCSRADTSFSGSTLLPFPCHRLSSWAVAFQLPMNQWGCLRYLSGVNSTSRVPDMGTFSLPNSHLRLACKADKLFLLLHGKLPSSCVASVSFSVIL